MKIKKILKIITILFIILNLTFPMIAVQARVVQGAQVGGGSGTSSSSTSASTGEKNTYNWQDKIDEMSKEKGNDDVNESVRNFASVIISLAQIIATGIAIIMLIVLAMKYMISASGERAEIKKHAIVYVIGAMVLFGAVGLLEIISNFASNF